MDLKITKRIPYFTHWPVKPVLLLLILSLSFSCKRSQNMEEVIDSESKPETVIKRRSDGTVSSINQVNANNRVHGIRATYYGDGKTVYSKQTFNHGRKQGPATWYYRNGQVYKQTSFKGGKRHGPTRIYYKSGSLSAEFESEYGNVLPGLKEYNKDGSQVTSYPDIKFRELDFLASKNRLDLEMYCTKKRSGVKFFILHEKEGETSRVYLITEDDSALLQFYVKPGNTLDRRVNIMAELPTELGNTLSRRYSYQLSVSN